jgi:hypothetical protein
MTRDFQEGKTMDFFFQLCLNFVNHTNGGLAYEI